MAFQHLWCWLAILIKGPGLGLFNSIPRWEWKNVRQEGTTVTKMYFWIFNGIWCFSEAFSMFGTFNGTFSFSVTSHRIKYKLQLKIFAQGLCIRNHKFMFHPLLRYLSSVNVCKNLFWVFAYEGNCWVIWCLNSKASKNGYTSVHPK